MPAARERKEGVGTSVEHEEDGKSRIRGRGASESMTDNRRGRPGQRRHVFRRETGRPTTTRRDGDHAFQHSKEKTRAAPWDSSIKTNEGS